MKFKITKEEFGKLPEAMQKEYAEADGGYTLKLEGHEETFVPIAKKNEAEKHRAEAERKLGEVEARETKLLADLEKAKGGSKEEIERIRSEAQAEIEKIKKENEAREAAALEERKKSFVDSHVTKFANEKFTTPSLISRAMRDRLTAAEVNGEMVLRVLDEKGNESVKSVSDLEKEFLENKEYASIIKGSQGSGGGATPPNKGGGGATPNGNLDLATASPKDLTAHLKAKAGQ